MSFLINTIKKKIIYLFYLLIYSNKKQNVAYHEVMYEVEPETYECQTSQPKKTNDKTVARSEIRRILRGMLDDISLNVKSLSYSLISKLEKIMTNLEESNFLEHKDSNKVQNLVEEHSLVGFNEMVIKNKLLEMAESDDGNSKNKYNCLLAYLYK